MKLVNRIKGWAGMEHRANGYTNAAVESLMALALGTGGQPSGTAAVAQATQAISAPFHLPSIRLPGAALSAISGGPCAPADVVGERSLFNRC